MQNFLSATQGDLDEAYRCSRLALGIFDKFNAKEWQARLSLAVYAFVFPLKRPLRECVDPLLEGHHAGIVFGDVCVSNCIPHASCFRQRLLTDVREFQFSALCAFMYCLIRLYAGDPIPEVLDAARAFRKNSFDNGQFVTKRYDILIQFCLNLMGKADDPLVLTGEAVDEEETSRLCETSDLVLLKALFVWKHLIAVYMNEVELASQLASKIEALPTNLLPFTVNTHIFLQALAHASQANKSSDHRHRAQNQLCRIRESAQHCPENYLHRVYLVEGELARVAGNHAEALSKYTTAVELAEKSGFTQEQAFAHEKAGLSLQSCGKVKEAKVHFVKARSLFQLWGAQIKVDQLTKYV